MEREKTMVVDTNAERGIDDANALQDMFERQQSLTTYHEEAVQTAIELYRALRETDANALRAAANWGKDRNYIPDPLAEKISEVFADMLFGEDPIFKSAQTIATEAATAAKARAAAVTKRQADALSPTPSAPVEPDSDTDGADDGDTTRDFPRDKPRSTLEEGSGPSEENQYDVVDDEPINDQELLKNIVEANDLPSELRASETICSSEGEVWWRIYTDQGQSDYPIIEWNSRSAVRPLFRGRKFIAGAYTDEIHREEINDQWRVFRMVQIQATGIVRNLLYRGTPTALGVSVPLTDRPETSSLEEEWQHNFGIMAGRVPNKLGRDRRVGVSDYRSVVDLLLSLNEGTTIGHENMRLTAKKRVAVPREAVTQDGTFDASEDVLIVDTPLDDQLGSMKSTGKFAVLEYSYDSEALIAQKLDTVATILNRVGIVAEMGAGGGGRSGGSGGGAAALSGTALRMRLIPTTLAANGKARFWDDQLPKIMMIAQMVDAAPVEEGGFGRPWQEATAPPSIERSQPLPTDETEETNRHVSAVGGEIESRRTAIADLHPDWDDEQVQEELDQIGYELKEFAPSPGTPALGTPVKPQIGDGGGGSHGADTSTDAG